VLAGEEGQSSDGVAMDAAEASRLASADPLVQVLQDRDDLLVSEPGLVERGPFIFRESNPTGVAAEEADVAVSPHEVVNGEVAAIADAVEFARAVLAAVPREIVAGHGTSITERGGRTDRVSMRGDIVLRQSARLKQPGTPPKEGYCANRSSVRRSGQRCEDRIELDGFEATDGCAICSCAHA